MFDLHLHLADASIQSDLILHSSYSFYILSALAFPGNRTHDLGIANAMLYQLSYRKTLMLYMHCGFYMRGVNFRIVCMF